MDELFARETTELIVKEGYVMKKILSDSREGYILLMLTLSPIEGVKHPRILSVRNNMGVMPKLDIPMATPAGHFGIGITYDTVREVFNALSLFSGHMSPLIEQGSRFPDSTSDYNSQFQYFFRYYGMLNEQKMEKFVSILSNSRLPRVIVHGDENPSNIGLGKDGNPYLIDFEAVRFGMFPESIGKYLSHIPLAEDFFGILSMIEDENLLDPYEFQLMLISIMLNANLRLAQLRAGKFDSYGGDNNGFQDIKLEIDKGFCNIINVAQYYLDNLYAKDNSITTS